MKIPLKLVAVASPVSFHTAMATRLDSRHGTLVYDEEHHVIEATVNGNGKTILIPLTNVSFMERQSEAPVTSTVIALGAGKHLPGASLGPPKDDTVSFIRDSKTGRVVEKKKADPSLFEIASAPVEE